MESWVQSWRPRTNAFCIILRLFHSICLKYCACHEKWSQVIRSPPPVTQNHLSKPEDPMLQNATPLRKSAPWPPNISNSCVSCTAPAIKKHLCRSSSNVPTCHCFWNATNPSRFVPFWQGAQSLAPATQSDVWTSKSAPYPSIFCMCDFDMCFAPPRRALFSPASTSQLPKVVRHWSALHILTSKCASRHNGVHFFNRSTSKSGPTLRCFMHFDLGMCFAPQRCALFRHVNFQKWSEHEVFLYILSWACASHHHAVHFFISHLARWLRVFSRFYSKIF